MFICPKIATVDTGDFSYLQPYKGIEFQLLSPNYLDELERAKDIMRQLPNLEYVCFHSRLTMVNLGYILANSKEAERFHSLLYACSAIASEFSVDVDVLCHIGNTFAEFMASRGFDYLSCLDELLAGTRVSVLLENSIVNLSDPRHRNICEHIFSAPAWERTHFCWDICHWQASENLLHTPLFLTNGLKRAMTNIHFSKTKNKDGYRFMDTHGRVHPNYISMVYDLKYIQNKGVDLSKVKIVAEITEEDYVNRPDLKKELLLLSKYKEAKRHER